MLPIDTSRRGVLKGIGAGTLATAVGSGSATAKNGGPGRVFTFNDLAGNQGPYVGTAGSIRGINAGGLPWVLDRGQAKLHADGRLQVKVKGLVLDPDDDRVPEDLAGTNPVPQFKAILSSLSFDGSGRTQVDLETETVPASGDGDAMINEVLEDVPDPCYAPIVFVTSPGGSWFAISGF